VCWASILGVAIAGDRCTFSCLRCFSVGCEAAVPEGTIKELVPADAFAKLLEQEDRSFGRTRDDCAVCVDVNTHLIRKPARVMFAPSRASSTAFRCIRCPSCTGITSFCADCRNRYGHDPLSCDEWVRWTATLLPQLLAERRAAGGAGARKAALHEAQEAATAAFLERVSKQCPACGVRITKADGCNHMKCGQHSDDRSRSAGCGHQFCWICMQPWAEHRLGQGGTDYFRCGGLRAEDSNAAQRQALAQEVEVTSSVLKSKYGRLSDEVEAYDAHQESWRIEVRFVDDAVARAEQLKVTLDGAGAGVDAASFVPEVFATLCEARSLLACTCAWECVKRWEADSDLYWVGGAGVRDACHAQHRALFGATEALSGMVARRRWACSLADIAEQASRVRAATSALRQTLRKQNSMTESELEAAESRQQMLEAAGDIAGHALDGVKTVGRVAAGAAGVAVVGVAGVGTLTFAAAQGLGPLRAMALGGACAGPAGAVTMGVLSLIPMESISRRFGSANEPDA